MYQQNPCARPIGGIMHIAGWYYWRSQREKWIKQPHSDSNWRLCTNCGWPTRPKDARGWRTCSSSVLWKIDYSSFPQIWLGVGARKIRCFPYWRRSGKITWHTCTGLFGGCQLEHTHVWVHRITSCYTFTASARCVEHVTAYPVHHSLAYVPIRNSTIFQRTNLFPNVHHWSCAWTMLQT